MPRLQPLVIGLVLAMAACDGDHQGGKKEASVEEPRSFENLGPEALTRRPYLRDVLPDNTVAYLRIPSPVGFIAGPGGNSFDAAKQSRPHVEAVRAIRDAMDGEAMRSRLGAAAWLVELLVQRIDAPLELALVQGEDAPAMMARAVVTTRLDVAGPEAANELLAKLADQHRMVRLQQPLTAQQDAVVGVSAGQLRLRWRDEASRLIGLAGLGTLSAEDLDARLAELSERDAHPMYEAEAEVDSSRRGLFGWVEGQQVRRALQRMPKREPGVELLRKTLANTRWMALGWGGKTPVTEGGRRKSRLKFVLSAPREGLRALAPSPTNAFDLHAAGEMDWMVAAALPDVATWRAFEGRLTGEWLNASQRQQYAEAKRELTDYLGFSVAELLRGLGPEVALFSDDAGRFLATRVQDVADGPDVANELLTSVVATGHETESLDGVTYHETRFEQPVVAMGREDMPDRIEESRTAAGLAAGSWSTVFEVDPRFYWLRKAGYVVQAGTPQALIERERYHRKTSVSDWLATEQGQDLDHAMLAASMSLDGGPRWIYRQYLRLLTHLGDAVGADIDPFAFPTATEAGIPVEGAYGLQINNAPKRFSVELTFEQTPAEIATASPYTMFMTSGVIAAVVIPQYQAYTQSSPPY